MLVVISILPLVLDSLIAITSNVSFVVLIRYSRSSQFLLRENAFRWNNFLHAINVIVLTIDHHVFRIFIEFDDKSLNWLNNKLRFGGGLLFLSVLKGNRSLTYLKQNHGSVQVLISWKSRKFH